MKSTLDEASSTFLQGSLKFVEYSTVSFYLMKQGKWEEGRKHALIAS